MQHSKVTAAPARRGQGAPDSLVRRALATAARAALGLAGLLLAFDARHASRLGLAPLSWHPLRGANQRRIRSRCMVVQALDGVAVCRVLGRYKMYVDASDHGHAVHLMFEGYWEMPVTQVVASLMRPGMTGVDVGANQGYYTLLMAGLAGDEGRVHAVEPNARMVALLRRSVAVNGFARRVHVHARPLGADDARRVVLRVPDGTPSGAYLEAAGGGPDDPDAMLTATLDGILGDERVDFIKIDAEGSERAIWEGARRILARGAPLTVVMEFFVDSAPDPAAFLEDIRTCGFAMSHIHNRHGLRPVTADQILTAPSNQEWMLVLQRGRQA